MKPIDFFTPDRLDLIVKYLQAKNYLSSIYNKDVEDLYIRHIIMRTGGIEPEDCLTHKTDKTSVMDYLNSFKNLILDMKQNGFNPKYPIPVDKHKKMLNGAHRIAAALALNIKEIPTEEVQGVSFCPWDFNWFQENGFSVEDKQRILKGYVDLHLENCSIFVIWQPALRYYGHIQKLIQDHLDIVGSFDLDFEDNYLAFENAILDIYDVSKIDGGFSTIYNKIKMLENYYLSFKVIVVKNRETKDDIFSLSKKTKHAIRKIFDSMISSDHFITLHSSDTVNELKLLNEILLSPNNMKYLRKRNHNLYDLSFLTYIQNFKKMCQNQNLNSDDTIIVGSGPLAALGIKSVSDLDFVVLEKYRNKYGDEPKKMYESIDLATKKYHRNGTSHYYTDDELIQNPDCHFIVNGIKFCNLDIVKERKKFSAREKDIRHVRYIELYEHLNETHQQNFLSFLKQKNVLVPKGVRKSEYKYRLHIGKFDLFSKRKKDNKRIYRILGVKVVLKK